jgi:hypothetical protein
MEETTQDWGKIESITFNTLGCGSIRLAKHLVTKKRLEFLCQVNNAILVDEQGDEISDQNGLFPNLSASKNYTVVSEEDLSGDEEEILNEEQIHQKQYELLIKNSQRIHNMNKARKQLIKELYKPKYPHLWNFSEVFCRL